MSRTKKLRDQLEAVSDDIEALDADLAAGRLGADEHRRRREAREREAGRLFVSLRQARGETRARQGGQPAVPAGPRLGWLRSPAVMGAAAALLVVVGVGAGAIVARWLDGPPPAAPGGGAAALPAGDPSALVSRIEVEALRQAAAREDAPIPGLLRLAHIELDDDRLDAARRVYERVLAREPRNVEAVTHVGGILYREGRVDEALAKVEEALRLDPRYIHAHWDRVQYLFHGKRDFPAAVKAAEAFLEIVPEGPDAASMRELITEARKAAAGGGG